MTPGFKEPIEIIRIPAVACFSGGEQEDLTEERECLHRGLVNGRDYDYAFSLGELLNSTNDFPRRCAVELQFLISTMTCGNIDCLPQK